MRWILFDLVVGAALVWLVWDGRNPDPLPSVRAAAAPAIPPVLPEPSVGTGPTAAVMPAPLPTPEPSAESVSGTPAPDGPVADVPAAEAPVDRRRRLQALAREAETLFLRGQE
ncbi:hypothetical protein GCM10017083_53060 [Thalassobaculum fulvum]|uniref:Uncharacterized protein n=1 Tax=Thalassobaculum fulvum TaxID=1633335 RepID=A0A918XX60_9PROT|nr:hypothetical protein [Thalassobaculum fulvum]GHD63194.1 hypothetical protein GCM10017083_53060 [Thalassobaculum fulvum]